MIRFLIISSTLFCSLLISGCRDSIKRNSNGLNIKYENSKQKRIGYLDHLLVTFQSDKDARPYDVSIWESWLHKSGELPPDFDALQSNAFPPELLRFQDGKPVSGPAKWPERKKEIKKILQQYAFGNWPPAPPKISVRYMESEGEKNQQYIKKNVTISFAPTAKAVDFAEKNRVDGCSFVTASLNIELYIPAGKGPFPAIIEAGSSRSRVSSQDLERLKRGYIVCRFNSKDAESIAYVYSGYECNQLEWWAYGAGRCVDLLYTLDNVDKSKIAIAGHSRGAKTALLAALMDERICAVVNSHPGTGTGSYNLWRYATDKFGGETLENSTRRYPYWNNPKMRFFAGRENKLPFDGHFYLALLAPRPCLLGTGEHDNVGEPWGDQQSYIAAKEVYKLLGKEKNLGFYASPGGHEVTPEMVNSYLDWLDMQFGRKPFTFEDKLIYSYSFDDWGKIKGTDININDFPEKDLNDILLSQDGKEINEKEEWETKAELIKGKIKQIIGDIPAYDKIEKVELVNKMEFGEDLIKAEIILDEKNKALLTFPAKISGKLPVVIYLHAYLDANGYNWSRGYGYSTSVTERIAANGCIAVEFEQLFGYGKRNRDNGIAFYSEHKDLSALGVMISDVSRLIDALSLLDQVDNEKIMVEGYSLGGMVALYSAVFDKRIKAVASTCGFGSMRLDVHGNQTEGLKRYSHLHPTIPMLGLFVGNEKRIPYDFHEILGLIAPRPVLILAPKLDQDWVYEDVEVCYREASKIYNLYGGKRNITLESPDDFNRFPPEYQGKINNWLLKCAKQ